MPARPLDPNANVSPVQPSNNLGVDPMVVA